MILHCWVVGLLPFGTISMDAKAPFVAPHSQVPDGGVSLKDPLGSRDYVYSFLATQGLDVVGVIYKLDTYHRKGTNAFVCFFHFALKSPMFLTG